MAHEIFKYGLTFVFVALTFYLSYVGMKKTKNIKSFSIGNKDMGPVFIGFTIATSISSTATFVINPGFVYADGFAAYMHYGVGACLGVMTAFFCLTKGFRKLGDTQGSFTIPDWIFHRYGSRGLSLFFAFINLLSIAFVVLILAGCSILMSTLFPVSQQMALAIILLFVFSYTLMGGTYAHAYTNTFQGGMMVIISLFLFVHGLKYIDGGFFTQLQNVGANYASIYNPDSKLYYDFFSVFLSSFLISFALMLQPHILTKVLYLKEDKDVNKFLATSYIVGFVFTLMLFIGFFAKFKGLEVPRQDLVVSYYINSEFATGTIGPYIMVFITITLLAAGISTLDGILVAISAMVVNDIYNPLFNRDGNKDPKKALFLSRVVLVIIGLISFLLAWNPPALVGIFAQKGVYGLAAASLVPILFGVLLKRPLPLWVVSSASVFAVVGHFYLNELGGVTNPSVSSAYAMLGSIALALGYLLLRKLGFTKEVLPTT